MIPAAFKEIKEINVKKPPLLAIASHTCLFAPRETRSRLGFSEQAVFLGYVWGPTVKSHSCTCSN